MEQLPVHHQEIRVDLAVVELLHLHQVEREFLAKDLLVVMVVLELVVVVVVLVALVALDQLLILVELVE